ncbi:DNA-nicking Smr family endonuclease [Dongia mobilis]|uniref:DNA-nicking Smr family endonuclease n=1 Tax=Dongia mobilis TaxID=578943 RepID=A0A4R6WXD1_9PROT|nr:Smr/MutS family protein [Dongia mobilis]TDQ82245.1 DNA-nicking Smr family endonuclease [Dongia mobilis]
MAGGDKIGRRGLGADELALWQAVAKSVTPLKRRRRKKAPAATEPSPAPEKKAAAPPAKRPRASKAPAPPPTAKTPAVKPPAPLITAPGPLPGIDKRQAERFRRGQIPIEGRIDLHGRTQAEAHDALHRFIERAHKAGKRQLLVITGKGAMKSEGGILKANVPRWLNEPSLRRHILAISEARPEHGGAGALYVLLKREK